METRFLLPATLATALHLLVLYGVKSPDERPPIPTATNAHTVIHRMVMNLEDPPEKSVDPELGDRPLKGEPDAYRPQLDETPARPSPFEQERAPINTRPDVEITRIAAGPPGIPDGIVGGVDVTVISSRFLDNPPRTRVQVPPAYPSEAKQAGVTGEVSVEFVVDESGRVHNARILESSDPRFDAATLKAVQKWRFEPGKKNGRPIRFRMVAPVVFSLNN
jgi:periplasmic protein TonB